MDNLGTILPVVDRIGSVATIIIVALAVITEKLVWYKRYERAVARANRWEKVAIEALTGPAQAGVRAAEVTADVVSALPDPQAARNQRGDERVDDS